MQKKPVSVLPVPFHVCSVRSFPTSVERSFFTEDIVILRWVILPGPRKANISEFILILSVPDDASACVWILFGGVTLIIDIIEVFGHVILLSSVPHASFSGQVGYTGSEQDVYSSAFCAVRAIVHYGLCTACIDLAMCECFMIILQCRCLLYWRTKGLYDCIDVTGL